MQAQGHHRRQPGPNQLNPLHLDCDSHPWPSCKTRARGLSPGSSKRQIGSPPEAATAQLHEPFKYQRLVLTQGGSLPPTWPDHSSTRTYCTPRPAATLLPTCAPAHKRRAGLATPSQAQLLSAIAALKHTEENLRRSSRVICLCRAGFWWALQVHHGPIHLEHIHIF